MTGGEYERILVKSIGLYTGTEIVFVGSRSSLPGSIESIHKRTNVNLSTSY